MCIAHPCCLLYSVHETGGGGVRTQHTHHRTVHASFHRCRVMNKNSGKWRLLTMSRGRSESPVLPQRKLPLALHANRARSRSVHQFNFHPYLETSRMSRGVWRTAHSRGVCTPQASRRIPSVYSSRLYTAVSSSATVRLHAGVSIGTRGGSIAPFFSR